MAGAGSLLNLFQQPQVGGCLLELAAPDRVVGLLRGAVDADTDAFSPAAMSRSKWSGRKRVALVCR